MKQNEFKGLDSKVKNIYDYGCYFMDLLFLPTQSEPTLEETLEKYDLFIKEGWMDTDCFIKNPTAILKNLTGKNFRVKKDSVLDKSATYVLARFYNPTTNLHHFVVMDTWGFETVKWDSIQNSNTVKNGFIESYRMFYQCK